MAPKQPELISNAAIAMLGTAISSVLGVLYVSIGARWLGPADYASVGAISSLANMLALALNAFETGVALRAASISGKEGRHALRAFCDRSLRAICLLSGAGFLLWLVAAPFIAPKIGYGVASFAWLGLLFFSSIVLCVPRGVMRAEERFSTFSLNLVVESAIRVGVGLALVGSIGGPASMVAGYSIAILTSTLLGIRQMRAFLPARSNVVPSRHSLREILEAMAVVSGPLLGLDLYSAVIVNGDVVAAEYYLGAHEAGLYAGAAQVSRMVLVAATPIVTVLVSRLAILSARREDTSATMWQGTALVLGTLLASFVVPFLGGSFVLRLLLGEGYVAAEPLLRVQWATTCVLTFQYFLGLAALSTSSPRAGWLFVLPALAVAYGFHFHHDTSLHIAWVALLSCATIGSLVCLALWRLGRGSHAPGVAMQTRPIEDES